MHLKAIIFDMDLTHLLDNGLLSRGLTLSCGASVDDGCVMVSNFADQSLLVKVSDSLASQRTIQLELLRQVGWGDQPLLGCLSEDLLVQLLVEQNGIVHLLLGLGLGPLLQGD